MTCEPGNCPDCQPGTCPDPQNHLLHLPMTSKEKRSVKLTRKLKPELTESQALEFVRIFYWHIRNAPSGVEGLLKK